LSSVVVLGFIILSGLVENNGIVLIDHINQLRGEGVELREAVVNGCVHRLRPILSSSFVSIISVMPLAVGIGKGDDLTQPLAVVTFGGLFISTCLTLLVIPVLYEMTTKWMEKRAAAALVITKAANAGG
jgi:HAE1 family hydrophobic/amphiphilic exporter-1